ncbi:Cof-type HAD-IIB family hydrolase [Candidatus Cyanaurora vandensis]|uniref:Cof-type HAD-IIB family hydrolase n=1 Tax=Candidatus Cyanaurora vandensis TaxID=2714958 RepID=UPI0025811744|nr:Cof-type HAD-IIB family hydrolase [Candidatus Cyanaurora vandensis]
MGIKLVALDLDGTVLGEAPVITVAVVQAIAAVQARGIPVVIVTGRMHRSALPYHQQIQSPLPLISYQGALIKDPQDGRVVRHLKVPRSLALDILSYLQAHQMTVHLYLNDNLYIQGPPQPWNLSYAERTGVPLTVVPDLARRITEDPTKLLAFWDQDTTELWAELQQKYAPSELYLTRSTNQFIEATHPQANKGAAVAYLVETLGLVPDQVLAIGDYFNDLEMIRFAGVGIAMATAPRLVQAEADWVAPPVTEDGVAVALHKFILD